MSDALLGELVSETAGEDLEIMRYNDESKPPSIRIGREYRYAYSTVASFRSTVLGTARVYLLAMTNDCDKLTNGRMKVTLQKLGYSAVPYYFNWQSCRLVRMLTAPVEIAEIIIIETLILRNIEHVLLPEHQCDSPIESCIMDDSKKLQVQSNITCQCTHESDTKRGVFI